MGKLVLTHNGSVVKEFPLNKERVTVGRKANNDIQLDDPTVSGHHAVFLVLQNVYIEDNNSTNGVLLNGRKVTRRQLNHGDVVHIGRHELKYIDDAAQSFEKTIIIPSSNTQTSAPVAKPASTAAKVKVISGPKAGDLMDLDKPYTKFGNTTQVAVIARRGNKFYLMPMSGVTDKKNPPRLNNKPTGAESMQLSVGDIIEVAGTRLEFIQE